MARRENEKKRKKTGLIDKRHSFARLTIACWRYTGIRIDRFKRNGGNAVDKELLSEHAHIERKVFSFDLRENAMGRFLKITEDVGGRRDTVIIPASGLAQIKDLLDKVLDADLRAGPFVMPDAQKE